MTVEPVVPISTLIERDSNSLLEALPATKHGDFLAKNNGNRPKTLSYSAALRRIRRAANPIGLCFYGLLRLGNAVSLLACLGAPSWLDQCVRAFLCRL